MGATVTVARIDTERLVLRPAQPPDRDGPLALQTDPRAIVP